MELEDKWDALLNCGVSVETLQIVTDINGYNDTTLDDVLYAKYGTHDWDDIA